MPDSPVPTPAAPPSLALGICTYNRGPKILNTLQAVAALDRAAGRLTRLIIIDNNSTDDTPRLIDQFAFACTAIPIARIKEPRQGLAFARRRLIDETSEPLLAVIDDDCLPAADWAVSMLRFFDAHPCAGMVGGKVHLQWESGPTPLARRCATMLAQQDRGDCPAQLVDPDDCLVGAAFVVRREALLASGWIDDPELSDRQGAALSSGGDFEMAIRIRAAPVAPGSEPWQVWYTPEPRIAHLIPPERQTLAYLARLARGVSVSKATLKWLARNRPDIDWVRAQHARARRRRLKSILLEWRPAVRTLKRAEHDGRCEGWRLLEQRFSAHDPSRA